MNNGALCTNKPIRYKKCTNACEYGIVFWFIVQVSHVSATIWQPTTLNNVKSWSRFLRSILLMRRSIHFPEMYNYIVRYSYSTYSSSSLLNLEFV